MHFKSYYCFSFFQHASLFWISTSRPSNAVNFRWQCKFSRQSNCVASTKNHIFGRLFLLKMLGSSWVAAFTYLITSFNNKHFLSIFCFQVLVFQRWAKLTTSFAVLGREDCKQNIWEMNTVRQDVGMCSVLWEWGGGLFGSVGYETRGASLGKRAFWRNRQELHMYYVSNKDWRKERTLQKIGRQ